MGKQKPGLLAGFCQLIATNYKVLRLRFASPRTARHSFRRLVPINGHEKALRREDAGPGSGGTLMLAVREPESGKSIGAVAGDAWK